MSVKRQETTADVTVVKSERFHQPQSYIYIKEPVKSLSKPCAFRSVSVRRTSVKDDKINATADKSRFLSLH